MSNLISRQLTSSGKQPLYASVASKQKAQLCMSWAFWYLGLGDDLLSHGYDRTIIGATSFHGPVRNGKGWVQRAMVAKNSGVVRSGILPW